MQAEEPLNVYQKPQNHFVGSFIGSPAMNFFKVEVQGKTLVNQKFKLAIADSHHDALKSYEGRQINLGIRPEHFKLMESTSSIKAHLEVSELMGNESYLYCTTGDDAFIARVSDNAPRKIGTELNLFADSGDFHFFDLESGQRIE